MQEKSVEKQGRIYYGWWVTGAAFIALFGGLCAGFYTVSVFLEPLQAAFGWTRTQLSLGFMFSSIFSGLISPLTGFLVARYGVRKIQIIGGVIVVTAMTLVSTMNALWQYYALLILQSAGLSFIGIIPCQTAVAGWFEEKRGLAMGIIMAGVGSGGMVMIFIASQAVNAFGWRWTYRLLAGIVLFIVIPVIIFFMKEKNEAGPSASGDPSVKNRTSISGAFGSIIFWELGILMLLFGMIIGAMTQHAIALLNSLDAGNPALIWSLALGVSVAGRLLFGRLADRFSKKYLVIICWVLAFISIRLVAGSGGNLVSEIGFSISYGLALGAFITLMPLALGEYFGLEHFSRLLGFVQLFLVIGLAFGTVVMGKTFDMTGSYHTGLRVLSGITLAGLMVSLIMPEKILVSYMQEEK